jgi:type I restriction enzyme R subunit
VQKTEDQAREKIDALLKQYAVANNVNVNHAVHKIDTEITKGGSRVEKGFYVDKRDRLTRKVRWEQLDADLAYQPNELDRAVVAP